MSMHRTSLLFISVVMILALPGCSVDATPTPAVSPVSPVSTPPVRAATPTSPIPAPANNKGTVTGILFDQRENKPYADRMVFLARISELQSAAGGEPIPFVELDIKSDPHADTDMAGRFVIKDVEPGKYAIAVWLPDLQQVLLQDAVKNATLSVEVKPNSISNMGLVQVAETR